MLRKSVVALLAVFTLSVFGFEARSQDASSEANKLFVEAVTLYREVQSTTGTAKSEAYAKVRALFDQILEDHPTSKPAKVIAQGGNPGGVLIASLPSSKPKGWNDGKRGIVRDLLAKYDNDVGAIENVAEAAVYAHLAWAAYDADEPKQFLEQRGWKIIEAYKGDRALVGDVTATLFEGPQGQHVLAFRGSVTGGDWVTNVGGTLSPTPLLNGQVTDALKLADEVAQKFPNVVFVGHSLGGRLAQASSLKTGKLSYAFNSAPVGFLEIRDMGFQGLTQGKRHRFRSPQDQLSGVFTPSDVVVANIEKVDANALFNLVNMRDYTHAMGVLTQAIQTVAVAWDQGWVTTYLDEKKAVETIEGKPDAEQSADLRKSVLDECNAIAAHPNDIGNPKVLTPVPFDKLVASQKNIEICLEALREAAPEDRGRYNYLVGRLYGKAGDDARYIKYLEAADRENYPRAIYRLGRSYHDGSFGLKQDYRKAFDYYQRANSLGDPSSMLNTAWMFEWGQGRGVDLGAATLHYMNADRIFDEFAMPADGANELCRLEFKRHRVGYAKKWCAKAAPEFSGSKERLAYLTDGITYSIDQCQSGGFSTMRNHQITMHVHGSEKLRLQSMEDKYARLSWKLLEEGCAQKGNRKAIIMQHGQKQIEFSQGSTQPRRSGTWFYSQNYARTAYDGKQRRLAQQRQQEQRRQEEARRQQAARVAAQQRQAELNGLKAQIDLQWAAHMNNMFSGKYVIDNVGDLLQYNRAKAISLLSGGVTLQLLTGNMSFQDGTVVISHEHDPTDIYRPVREAELASMREMDRFLRKTQTVGTDFSGPSVNVVCRLSASALEQLDGQTVARFDAKMQSLNGRSAIFNCKLKR